MFSKKIYICLFHLLVVYSLNSTPNYQLINLKTLDYQTSKATSINCHGQICGKCRDHHKNYIFISDPSQGSFNYAKVPTLVNPLINKQTEIFGCQLVEATDNIWDYEQEIIFCWKNPLSYFTFLNIAGLGLPKEAVKHSPFDQKRTVLWDINDHGELLIMNSDSLKNFLMGNPREFKYQVWVYTQNDYKLISHPHFCVGFSLNNQSEILGYYYKEQDLFHRDSKVCSSIYNLKTDTIRFVESPPDAIGKSINDLGEVVGVFRNPKTQEMEGFLSDSSGNCTLLHHFHPIKNNNHNRIIGKFSRGKKKGKPAIWDDGQLYDVLELVDLNDNEGMLWDSLDELIDLNDEGHIIGQGHFQGNSHAFLLRPSSH